MDEFEKFKANYIKYHLHGEPITHAEEYALKEAWHESAKQGGRTSDYSHRRQSGMRRDPKTGRFV